MPTRPQSGRHSASCLSDKVRKRHFCPSSAKRRGGRQPSLGIADCARFVSADDDELGGLIPSRATHRALEQLLDTLRDVESVSKKLQSESLTMVDARALFDGLLEVLPSFSTHIVPDAEIVQCPEFETAAVKVLMRPFEREVNDVSQTAGMDGVREDGFADRILKRRKTLTPRKAYDLIAIIPPSSNVVERLFSSARAALCHEHHRLSPMALKMVLFLKVNESYWNVSTVTSCI
ncbi:hypothetical protein PPTG_11986 [Phytophthora nicotianae INRA-310]|uniref:HAT C-terminal dimerisation domain-containing protein n=1 Tax=Phytophthora nicotianae (strain INRA-310) TaxID=761204 RepID=W2Q4P9_PHYN3|nr:hypothetical protein PPTG_11986 [Phytophthora nicotianae INRA-310]ETN08122.1 hypothetical protein PPTG_11986 [Phytophthora nicotianae INRA-310]